MMSGFCVPDPMIDITCVWGTQGCARIHEGFNRHPEYDCRPDKLLSCACSRGTQGCPINHLPTPIPMVIHCPDCGKKHVDEGEWATKEHKTHLCSRCKALFRPANVPTVGVEKLIDRG